MNDVVPHFIRSGRTITRARITRFESVYSSVSVIRVCMTQNLSMLWNAFGYVYKLVRKDRILQQWHEWSRRAWKFDKAHIQMRTF
jgi:hypothetical protein